MRIGKYYTSKKQGYNYSEQLDQCIKDTCQYCMDNTFGADAEKQRQPIMMLGKIQSGKTRAFTGLIALAFDNDFDMVFILTKNSKALVQQTESRMKKEFKDFVADNKVEVKNIIKMSYSLTGYQLEKKLIIIAKKEKNNLDKLIDFIEKYSITQIKKTIIIDDEADTTGIGYGKIKNTDEYDLRTVAAKVNDLTQLNSIERLGLPMQSCNVLWQSNISTIGDVAALPHESLIALKNVEEQTITGVYYFLWWPDIYRAAAARRRADR